MSYAWVISPHADDESIGCGGTIRRLTRGGWTVDVLLVTAPAEGDARMREAAAAMAMLGCALAESWNVPEQTFRATGRAAEKLASLFAARPPQLILAPHAAEADRDHREVALMVMAALDLWTSGTAALLGFEVWSPLRAPDLMIDISDAIEDKRRAIRCFESQLAKSRYDDGILGLNAYRAAMFGRGSGHAEAFAVRLLGGATKESICIP